MEDSARDANVEGGENLALGRRDRGGAVVHVHGLRLCEEVETPVPHLGRAAHAVLHAAEGHVRVTTDRGLADVGHTDLGLIDEATDQCLVVGVDRTTVAEVRAVQNAHAVIEVTNRHHHDHAAEALLVKQYVIPVVGVSGEDGRGHVVPPLEGAARNALATVQNLHARLDPALDHPHHSIELEGGHERFHGGRGIDSRAHLDGGRQSQELLDERVVEGLVHQHALRSGTALAGRAEARGDHVLREPWDAISPVRHDHHGVEAAHLADRTDAPLVSFGTYHATDLDRTGEGHGLHVVISDEGSADRAVAVNEVHDTVRDSCLLEDQHEQVRGVRGELGGLVHDAVAREDGGKDLPDREGDREVEGGDGDHDPEGSHAHEVLDPGLVGHDLAGPGLCVEVAVELRDRRGLLNLAESTGHGLADFHDHRERELVLVGAEEFRDALADGGSLARSEALPEGERRMGGTDGRASVALATSGRDRHDAIGVGRVPALEDLVVLHHILSPNHMGSSPS